MIDGIFLGFISFVSLALTWWNLPEFIKSFTLRHHLISDLLAGLFTFAFLSGISKSIIAVIGTTVTGLLVNISLILYGRIYGA